MGVKMGSESAWTEGMGRRSQELTRRFGPNASNGPIRSQPLGPPQGAYLGLGCAVGGYTGKRALVTTNRSMAILH